MEDIGIVRLRELEEKDAPLMLEWMHDENVASNLGKDFRHMTIEDCRNFIRESGTDDKNRHFAIEDENGEYMGTISLKNIDCGERRAEYAISCRSKAIGHGYALRATRLLFEEAYELGLRKIYLDVYDFNIRAQRMYEKAGFVRTEKPEFLTGEYDESLLWFEIELPEQL